MRAGSIAPRSPRCWSTVILKGLACRCHSPSPTIWCWPLCPKKLDPLAAQRFEQRRDLRPIGACPVDPENAQRGGEECQLLEREPDRAIGRMALDVGVE